MSGSQQRSRVVIVGGGLAGMSAAEALAQSRPGRFQITLIEAKRQTGGRAGSFSEPASGESVDYCQHVAMGCCTNFLSLMKRCGLHRHFRRYSELRFLHPDHPPSKLSPSRWLPAPLHLARTISNLTYLCAEQKRQVRRGLWRLMRTDTKSLRDQTATAWLSEQGQAPETIRDFWDVILVSALGELSDAVSMSAARKVFMDGFAAARGACDVVVPTLTLAELFGQRLANSLADLKIEIRQQTPAQSVVRRNGETMIELQAQQNLKADHVILAVPWNRIGDLLQEAPVAEAVANLAAFGQIPSSPITGIHLWLDRAITDRPHTVMVGTISQWLFHNPTNRGDGNEHYYQVVISASHDARRTVKAELVGRVLDELRHAFPDAQDAQLIRHRVVTDPNAVYSIRPEVDVLRPTASTALPWLHLAGDWIATGWPATMEGAVISGRMAASSLLKQEGCPPPEIDDGLPHGWLARRWIRP